MIKNVKQEEKQETNNQEGNNQEGKKQEREEEEGCIEDEVPIKRERIQKERSYLVFKQKIVKTPDVFINFSKKDAEERSNVRFEEKRVGIAFLHELEDGSIFIISDYPVLINVLTGPSEPSSYYIVRKDGTFEVCSNKVFGDMAETSNTRSISTFLNDETRQNIFYTDSAGGYWPKVRIETVNE
jgi:hypothetical protein